MNKLTSIVAASLMALSGAVAAESVALSDSQMDSVTAGSGMTWGNADVFASGDATGANRATSKSYARGSTRGVTQGIGGFAARAKCGRCGGGVVHGGAYQNKAASRGSARNSSTGYSRRGLGATAFSNASVIASQETSWSHP